MTENNFWLDKYKKDVKQIMDAADAKVPELNKALELAAQAWCTETTSSKVMDVDLAHAFAEIIVDCKNTEKQYEKEECCDKQYEDCEKACLPDPYEFITHEYVQQNIDRICAEDYICLGYEDDKNFSFIKSAISSVTRKIITNTGCSGHAWVVVSPWTADPIIYSKEFCKNYTPYHMELNSGTVHEIGVLSNKWMVFIDDSLDVNYILVGVGIELPNRQCLNIGNCELGKVHIAVS